MSFTSNKWINTNSSYPQAKSWSWIHYEKEPYHKNYWHLLFLTCDIAFLIIGLKAICINILSKVVITYIWNTESSFWILEGRSHTERPVLRSEWYNPQYSDMANLRPIDRSMLLHISTKVPHCSGLAIAKDHWDRNDVLYTCLPPLPGSRSKKSGMNPFVTFWRLVYNDLLLKHRIRR